MLKSMTGFGRGESTSNDRSLTIEMKSVNHRYCDINIRMPRKLAFMENALKNRMKEVLTRGKIDVYINYDDHSDKASSVVYNEALAGLYLEHLRAMGETYELLNDINVSQLSRFPEVLKLEEQDDDEDLLVQLVNDALNKALAHMSSARETEGEMLCTDLIDKLTQMLELVAELKGIAPAVIEDYREKLHVRISEMLDQTIVDQDRLTMEVAVFADKSCIDEEIVRLESHIRHMRDLLSQSEPVGRKLDFIAQEMNREANTILSKANNINVSNQGIELKTLIEKVREQIQNIE